MNRMRYLILMILVVSFNISYALGVRAVNLGLSSFYDGMPLPKGLYLRTYGEHFDSEQFNGSNGNKISDTGLQSWVIIPHLIYQTDFEILKGRLGTEALLPFVVNLNVEPNEFRLTVNNSGLSDFIWGAYIQWDPVKIGSISIANRANIDVYFPTGSFRRNNDINPGFNYYSFEPYWAATVLVTPRYSIM